MSQTPLIDLKCRSKTGQVVNIQVAELLEIDGRPFQPGGDVEQLRNHLIHLDGRVTALERMRAASEGA